MKNTVTNLQAKVQELKEKTKAKRLALIEIKVPEYLQEELEKKVVHCICKYPDRNVLGAYSSAASRQNAFAANEVAYNQLMVWADEEIGKEEDLYVKACAAMTSLFPENDSTVKNV